MSLIVTHCQLVNSSQLAGPPMRVPLPEAPVPPNGMCGSSAGLVVDVQQPRAQAVAERQRAADRLREHTRRQAVFVAVGEIDCLVFGGESGDRSDRAEHLFVEGAHAGLHTREDGRPVEWTVEGAAGGKLGAGGDRILDDAVDAIDLRTADDRAERHLPRGRVADRQMLRLGDELLGQRIGDLLVRDDEAGGHADLPLVEPGAESYCRGDPIEIGVLKHDDGVLAAELELHFLEMLASKLADAAADRARSRERDHRDVGIGADRLAGLGAAGQDLQHAFGQARLLEQARDDEAPGERSARIGLEHDSVAGGERGRDGAAGQDQREVERRDHADDAARHTTCNGEPAAVAGQHQTLRLRAHRRRAVQDARHHLHLELRFRLDAAGLAHDPIDQLGLVLLHQGGDFAQNGGALVVGGGRPARLRGARFGRGLAHVLGGGVADPGDDGAGGGLHHVEGAADRRTPLRAEQAAAPRRTRSGSSVPARSSISSRRRRVPLLRCFFAARPAGQVGKSGPHRDFLTAQRSYTAPCWWARLHAVAVGSGVHNKWASRPTLVRLHRIDWR